MKAVSPEACAQARYALFEKLQSCKERLFFVCQVCPEESDNVVFWRGEVKRVGAALAELDGAA